MRPASWSKVATQTQGDLDCDKWSLQRLEIGNQIVALRLILDPEKDHCGPWDRSPRVSQIEVESLLVPGMVELLQARGVVEVFQAGRFAADDAEQARPDLVALPGLDGMA